MAGLRITEVPLYPCRIIALYGSRPYISAHGSASQADG